MPNKPSSGSDAAEPSRKSRELSQLPLWFAANLAGMVNSAVRRRAKFFKGLAAKLGRTPPVAAQAPSPQESLPMLASAIVGTRKETIAGVFGPPRSAALRDRILVHPRMLFWQADVWYYPLPKNGSVAMAINFDDDVAKSVEFFTSPQIPSA